MENRKKKNCKKYIKLFANKEYILLPDVLSMDEYIEFVQFCWDNVVDHEAYWKSKEAMAVDVPFKFK